MHQSKGELKYAIVINGVHFFIQNWVLEERCFYEETAYLFHIFQGTVSDIEGKFFIMNKTFIFNAQSTSGVLAPPSVLCNIQSKTRSEPFTTLV